MMGLELKQTAAQIAIRKANDAKDLNIDDRISKIQDQLKN